MGLKNGIVLTLGDVMVARHTLGPYAVNAYELVCRKTGQGILIDAPQGIDTVRFQAPLKALVLTHTHVDHIQGLQSLVDKTGIPVWVQALDAPRLPVNPDLVLQDDQDLAVGSLTGRVLHTPGHTPGSLCLRFGQVLFSGDTLFPNGPGRTETPAAFRQILASLTQKIFTLPDTVLVFPGHGPPTNVGYERTAFEAFLRRGVPENMCGDVAWSA
ncbi:MBL fold metallo-hydrolase [Desulfosoma caldarium]|uniref:Glyoxylase-like metal-dependent hydrolase (Beta-lactamase superfamily II) n=1 Tax=Desulfosoma caldarium TaxID=610254 RepID=A0A3N1VJC2_9BACT|nr:MBL fold metallo-hydrolase [Desulfosoma caldarium]ROR02905.1 glyoxylase-like metal-dependent hydrolase (beta-lactamase superfamily II) [Desulfosoma caldarium]